MVAPKVQRGWYRLPSSGHPYYGVIPEGAEVIDADATAEDGPSIPAKGAPKAKWVAYAVTCGWSPEDAERKTKAELVAELGSPESVEQDVQTGEGDGTVGPEVPGDDLATDPLEGGTVEGDVGVVDQQGDDHIDGHEGEG